MNVMANRYDGINGMSGTRLADYEARLQTIIDYFNKTPRTEQLPDHKLAPVLGVTQGSVERARYMMTHNCSASVAIDALTLRSTGKRPNHRTWRNELSCGQASIDLLTRSWSAA